MMAQPGEGGDAASSVSSAEGISHGKVLYDSGDSFKRFMNGHTNELIKEMTDRKILKKRLSKVLKKEEDPRDMLLGNIKGMSEENFITYLQALMSLGTSVASKELMEDTRKLMRIMKGSLEAMKAKPHTALDSTISEFIRIALEDQLGTKTAVQVEGQTQITSSTTTIQETIKPVVTETITAQTEQSEAQTEVKQSKTQSEPEPQIAVGQTKTEQSQTLSEPQQSTAQKGPQWSGPNRPPKGQFGEAVSGTFTYEGGELYSPIHGVSVSIPPNAIPVGIECFLSMHFYLSHPFAIADDTGPCSVIVWFYYQPYFEFQEDILIEIPHAGSDPDTLSVMTWGENKEGPVYKLDTGVPADFSDGYHAVFKVKHFSPYCVAKSSRSTDDVLHRSESTSSRKRTSSNILKQLEKMDSDSIERSFDEGLVIQRSCSGESSKSQLSRQQAMDCESPELHVREEGGARYAITCSMPQDRPADHDWEVSFAACYTHPCGLWVLRQYAAEKYGCDYKSATQVGLSMQEGYVEFSVGKYTQCWRVEAPTSPVTISEERILQIPEDAVQLKDPALPEHISKLCYPPSVSYDVSHDGSGVPQRLECTIVARQALTANGNTPRFKITSSKYVPKKDERVLQTCLYLYKEQGDVIQALTDPDSYIILNTSNPDHIKFLADISLQVTATELCKALRRPSQEDTFMVLRDWVCSRPEKTITMLKTSLGKIGITDIFLSDDDNDCLLSPHLDKFSVLEVFREKLSISNTKVRLTLPKKLQCCWRDVGLLMGIAPTELDDISLKNVENSWEKSYLMIYQWQRAYGNDAKFGTLFKAVHRLWDHKPGLVNDAYTLCKTYTQNHLPLTDN